MRLGTAVLNVRYVCFFRDAAAKFIRSVVYVKVKKYGASVRDFVEKSRRRVTNAVAWWSII